MQFVNRMYPLINVQDYVEVWSLWMPSVHITLDLRVLVGASLLVCLLYWLLPVTINIEFDFGSLVELKSPSDTDDCNAKGEIPLDKARHPSCGLATTVGHRKLLSTRSGKALHLHRCGSLRSPSVTSWASDHRLCSLCLADLELGKLSP